MRGLTWVLLWFSIKYIVAGLEISYSDHPKITFLKYIPLLIAGEIVCRPILFFWFRELEKDEK